MSDKKKSTWKYVAIGLGIIGLGYGGYKITQFITEKTRANRVQINFVR